jgi:hypothetical protein
MRAYFIFVRLVSFSVAPLALVAMSLFGVSGFALAQQPPTYVFDALQPPQMKILRGQVFSLPDSALSQVIGTATWTVPNISPGGWHYDSHTYTLTRTLHWVRSPTGLISYASDTNKAITEVHGYSRTQASSFEQTLGGSAGGSLFGLVSVNVQAALKMTNSDSQTWHDEITTATNRTFKADVSYLLWNLIDSYHLVENGYLSGRCCATTPTHSVSDLDIALGIKEDHVTNDELAKLMNGEGVDAAAPREFTAGIAPASNFKFETKDFKEDK